MKYIDAEKLIAEIEMTREAKKRLLNNPDGELHLHVEPQYKDEKCENYLHD